MMIKKTSCITLLMLLCCHCLMAAQLTMTSPNGKLSLLSGDSSLTVCYGQQPVLELPAIGFASASVPTKWKQHGRVKADYQMLSGKRHHCTNEANEYVATLAKGLSLVVRLYNDGLAFRYEMSGSRRHQQDATPMTELTTFRIPEGTKRWMQQWTDSYEGFFPLTTSYKTRPVPSFSGVTQSPEGWNLRWGYPALLQPAEDVFALITEANIERGQSASCLFNDGELYCVVPDGSAGLETVGHTPWRVVMVGSLADVVASTLVTDVSQPCRIDDVSWIEPGVVSWIYWAYNHGSNDLDIIKRYVDLAVKLHLPYVLIDAEWDEMRNGHTIEEAVVYARQQGVKPMIWYNSSVGWVDGAPTPKFRLNKPEDREREFAWCEKLGIAGVKIDFFSGDTQLNMDYCIDLLESAAKHHLLVNFHGATIPRGWQRTWPNLMSTEGVYGAEWYNNVATFTQKAAAHNATLPFTRNVVGPMDYTPCAFSDSQHPHITTHSHELALTVLFESALQHLADRPESFLAQPAEVQQFLSTLPTTWDETRLVSGYPGHHVVIARRSGSKWYVAGINGTDTELTVTLDLSFIGNDCNVTAWTDSGDAAAPWHIYTVQTRPQTITLRPRGGFIFTFFAKSLAVM